MYEPTNRRHERAIEALQEAMIRAQSIGCPTREIARRAADAYEKSIREKQTAPGADSSPWASGREAHGPDHPAHKMPRQLGDGLGCRCFAEGWDACAELRDARASASIQEAT